MLGPPSSVLHVTVQMSKESYPNWLHWVRGYECVKDPRKLFVLLIKRTGCNGYNHSSFAFFFFFFLVVEVNGMAGALVPFLQP